MKASHSTHGGVGQPEFPPCFGDPAVVCPRDERGIIEPREQCIACGAVKACLQKALQSEGVLPKPFLETPAAAKVTGFLKRWSRQKLTHSRSAPVRSHD